jgi:hypothetical protein
MRILKFIALTSAFLLTSLTSHQIDQITACLIQFRIGIGKYVFIFAYISIVIIEIFKYIF